MEEYRKKWINQNFNNNINKSIAVQIPPYESIQWRGYIISWKNGELSFKKN